MKITSFWGNILFGNLFAYFEILGIQTFIVGFKHCIWCFSIIKSHYQCVNIQIMQVNILPHVTILPHAPLLMTIFPTCNTNATLIQHTYATQFVVGNLLNKMLSCYQIRFSNDLIWHHQFLREWQRKQITLRSRTLTLTIIFSIQYTYATQSVVASSWMAWSPVTKCQFSKLLVWRSIINSRESDRENRSHCDLGHLH